jgi:hypothetical protein
MVMAEGWDRGQRIRQEIMQIMMRCILRIKGEGRQKLRAEMPLLIPRRKIHMQNVHMNNMNITK